MKRTGIKRIGVISTAVVGSAIFMFLMLPFLDKTPSATTQTVEEEKEATATPQIFTSNPLTDIVQRIAHFFNGKKASPAKLSLETDEIASADGEEAPLMASAQRNDINYLSSQASAITGAQQQQYSEEEANQAFSDAMMMDEDGDWIFVRQRAPEGTATGMHEINVHDNAYDAYVKQQRNAKWSPTAADAPVQEVPDYGFARKFLVNPIKNFFGFKDPTPTKGYKVGGASTDTASSSGKTDGLGGKFGDKRPTTLAQFRDIEAAFDRFNPGQRPFADRDTASDAPSTAQEFWASLLDPSSIASRTGRDVADMLYPAPTTKEDKEARERTEEDSKAKLAAILQQKYAEILQNTPQLEDNSFTRTIVCEPSAMNHSIDHAACGANIPETSEEKIRAIAEENKSRIRQALDLPADADIPVLEWTPVYGAVPRNFDIAEQTPSSDGAPRDIPGLLIALNDPDTPEEVRATLQSDLDRKTVLDQYQKQLENESCGNGDCYLVANDTPYSKELGDGIKGGGGVYRPDPINKSGPTQDDYVNGTIPIIYRKIADELGDEKKAQEITNNYKEYIKQHPTPYSIYSLDDMNIPGVNYYVQNPHDAKPLLEMHRTSKNPSKQLVIFSHGEKGNTSHTSDFAFSPQNNEGPAFESPTFDADRRLKERSAGFTQDLIDNVQRVRDAIHQVKKEAAEQAMTTSMSGAVKSGNKQTQQTIKEYNKTASPTGGSH